MKTESRIKKMIKSLKFKRLTDEDYEKIQKECEKDEREIRERQKISHEDMNRPMDI